MPPSLTTTLGQAATACDPALPLAEHLGVPSLVGPDPERTAHVVEDDRRFGEGAREVGEIRELRMVLPGVEHQSVARQTREALAELRVEQQMLRWIGVRVADVGARVPARGVTDAAKAWAGGEVRFEHLVDRRAQREVGVADDAGGDARRARAAALGLGRDALDEIGLAHRTQRLGTSASILGHALDEHGRGHVMALSEIGEQLIEHVARSGAVPQVVMGIADRKTGLECRFSRRLWAGHRIGHATALLGFGSAAG